MADRSAIEWTDATWNPVRGCSRVSPGCGGPHHEGGCYAEAIAARFSGPGQPYEGFAERTLHGGRWTGKLSLVDEHLTDPLRWRRPRRIFVNSMSDLFHEALPDEVIDKVFAVMALAPHHTFQVLTKRPERMIEYLKFRRSDGIGRGNLVADTLHSIMAIEDIPTAIWLKHRARGRLLSSWPLVNVLLGTSVEDQKRADERHEPLAFVAGAGWRTFVSYEPALGPVDWAGWKFLSWLISGGESGPRARPSHPDWHRAARDFCAAHGIPYFFKQWGEYRLRPAANGDETWPAPWFGAKAPRLGIDVATMERLGKRSAGRLLDGVEHNAMPNFNQMEPA